MIKSQSIAWKVEESLIIAFKSDGDLNMMNPVHEDSDFDTTRPSIVFKGIAEVYVPGQNNVGNQLYKVSVAITLRANRAKLKNDQAEIILKRIMDLLTQIRSTTSSPNSFNLQRAQQYIATVFSYFQPVQTEEGERERQDETRTWTRNIGVLCQEIS
jgi:hypothetical protein